MKEYERVTAACGSLPRTVYQICTWTVRDIGRLNDVLDAAEMQRNEDSRADGSVIVIRPDPVSYDLERAAAERIRCVDMALAELPEEYRDVVVEAVNIRGKRSPDWAHENTIKEWKRRFIYALAGYMHLI